MALDIINQMGGGVVLAFLMSSATIVVFYRIVSGHSEKIDKTNESIDNLSDKITDYITGKEKTADSRITEKTNGIQDKQIESILMEVKDISKKIADTSGDYHRLSGRVEKIEAILNIDTAAVRRAIEKEKIYHAIAKDQ